ncbi:unnamed protein product [Linum tenue]|uniref:ATP synthase 24 kDa subunit, mitochondrial n=1 Tax=Linum tenue TaxID=586396 RepID=A0AAV0RBG5_9ROSI|nr:unnamed protein product [Linum tenue]
MASRLLSRSRQLYASQVVLHESAIPARYFSAKSEPELKGDVMLKNIFLDVKKKFETAMGILRKEKITIAPEDPAAVSQYAKVMKTIREKTDLWTESQTIKNAIESETKDIPDARGYLLKLQDMRIKLGVRREDLPKYEEQLELKIAKAQLEELKKEAEEAMDTQKKREEFKDEEVPDVKSLDIRNFI